MEVIDGKQNQFFNGVVTEDVKYTTVGETKICQMIIMNNFGEDGQQTVNPMLTHNE